MGKDLKKKTKKGIYWTFINQFANNGLQFVVGVVMARLLSPSDYGITALLTVFIAIAMVLIECGFGSALIRKMELTEKDLSTSFYYSITVGIACYVLLFICAPWIADFYSTPILTPLVRVTALSFIWIPLTTPQTIILKRKLDFKTYAGYSTDKSIMKRSTFCGFVTSLSHLIINKGGVVYGVIFSEDFIHTQYTVAK